MKRPVGIAIILAGALVALVVNAQVTRPGGGIVPPGKIGGGAGGGTITSVTAGSGVTGGGASGGVTLDVGAGSGILVDADHVVIDQAYTQRRVSTTCAVSGQFMTAIAADGTPTCTAEPGDITSVVAGTGLTGGATAGAATLNVDTTTIQSRVTGSCTAGNSIRVVNSDGTVTCQAAGTGTVTSITAGTGLSGGTISTSGTIAVNLTTTTCSAGQAETATAATGTSTCSTFVDTAGTGLSLSGHTLSTNLTGGTCGADQYVTAISSSGAATCSTPIINDYGQTHYEAVDEWMQNGCVSNNAACGGTWSTANGGTTTISNVGSTTRPGVIQLSVGTGTTNRQSLITGTSSVDFGSGNWSLEWVGGFETLSDTTTNIYAAFIGFGNINTAINQQNGCGFLYDVNNVATSGANGGKVQNLECYCASSNTRTVYLLNGTGNSDESFALGTVGVSALTLPSTNILHLLVKMTGNTRAEFYTVSGTTQTKVCDINTHIPSGASNLTGGLQLVIASAGTLGTRSMDVDYTRLAEDLTSARSP